MNGGGVAAPQGHGAFREPEKTWKKSAPSQIVLNSIFAALSAVLITIVVSDSLPHHLTYWENKYKFGDLVLTLLSFFLFAMSAEGTTNAYDEKDVRKYVYYLLLYNLGVISLGFALALFVGVHFLEHLARFGRPVFCFLSERAVDTLVCVVYFLAFVGLQWHWIDDVRWLLFSSDTGFAQYLKELTDEAVPESDPTCLMRMFNKRRNV